MWHFLLFALFVVWLRCHAWTSLEQHQRQHFPTRIAKQQPKAPDVAEWGIAGPGASLKIVRRDGKIVYERTNPGPVDYSQPSRSYVQFGAAGAGAQMIIGEDVLRGQSLEDFLSDMKG